MKNLSLLICAFFCTIITYGQNTNHYPPSGNVGVGTTTPSEALEVVGNIKANGVKLEFDQNFIGYPFTISDQDNLEFKISTNPQSHYFALNYKDRNDNNRLIYASKDNDNSYFKMFSKTGSERIGMMEGTVFGNFIHLLHPNSRIVIGSSGAYLYDDGHKFVVKDGSAMIEGNILTNSNLGIGTNSFSDGADSYRLSVNGKVRAHAVKVYTDWADFVFEDDYNLPSLKEVEQYIKENGHLKNIPSAKEVKENGIELGEMNKLLLQKIEELTLYTIQLKKEIEDLKSKID